MVVVASATPVHNPKELIELRKGQSRQAVYSSSGIGDKQRLRGKVTNTMAGMPVLHVPYRGSAPAVTEVATRRRDNELFKSRGGIAADIGRQSARRGGRIARKRMPQLPNVAPLREGAPGTARYELLNWFAMLGTTGTPGANCRAAQRDRKYRAQGPGHCR